MSLLNANFRQMSYFPHQQNQWSLIICFWVLMIFWLKWNDRKGMKKGKQKQKTKTIKQKKQNKKNTWGKSQRNNPLLSYYNYINFLIRIRLFITFITQTVRLQTCWPHTTKKLANEEKRPRNSKEKQSNRITNFYLSGSFQNMVPRTRRF